MRGSGKVFPLSLPKTERPMRSIPIFKPAESIDASRMGCGRHRGKLLEPGSHDAFAGGHFVQQQLRRLHQRVCVEPALHHVIAKQIGDGEQRHSLVMSHPLARQLGAPQRRNVVCRLVEAVRPDPL
jgi:hypothetical protein